MVVLTIVTQKNGETVYFDEPIPQVHYMRLISCSLYNSWHNLTRVGTLTNGQTGEPVATVPEGNYNFTSLANELRESFKDINPSGLKMEISTNTPNSVMKIRTSIARPVSQQQGSIPLKPNSKNIDISVSHDLARLMGTGIQLRTVSYIKKLNTPSAYFIHCDLINPTQNFFNGKRSDILAKFDISGLPYGKFTYPSLPQEALRECSTGQEVKQITLSVKDQSGEMFDFEGLPLEFILEIN